MLAHWPKWLLNHTRKTLPEKLGLGGIDLDAMSISFQISESINQLCLEFIHFPTLSL